MHKSSKGGIHSLISRREFIAASSGALAHAAARGVCPNADTNVSLEVNARLAAARGVLERVLGDRAHEFELRQISDHDTKPAYRVSGSSGTVTVQGNSAVAICRGVYKYLRDSCHCMVTWSGQNLKLPVRLPDQIETEVASPYQFVQYYNTCTFGYSTAFWDWARWEREIDWMALHGINMPLAMEGQEAVWRSVWNQMGLPQAELVLSSVGPAYLPWFRMGNITHFDGPLSDDWIDKKAALQRKILDRMRELEMVPVVPGFAGFVPDGFTLVRPDAKTFTELWMEGMPRLSRTFILDPGNSEIYREIGSCFIREYKKMFGPTRYYLADVFNELKAPVSVDHRYQDLASFSRSVFGGINGGDPEGVWVMQGWLFRNQPEFWDEKSIAAFLSSVPDDRMIILDISNDAQAQNKVTDPTAGNTWKSRGAFYGKHWINGMIHTFGGNNNVKGNLLLMCTQPATVLVSEGKGNLIGWGMDPEGIENNEVVYELMTDIGWSNSLIDLKNWISGYCHARYGACPSEMDTAWSLLLNSAYSWHPTWNSQHAWQGRPTLNPIAQGVETGTLFQKATWYFLACGEQLSGNRLYVNDLIELTAQTCGGWVDRRLQAACEAHKMEQHNLRDQAAEEALEMLLRIDGLVNVRPDRRLETWATSARRWGGSEEEKARYDADSRRLITCWGWESLYDYASRVWAGLIRDYYLQRWKVFFASLKQGKAPALDTWEEEWLSFPYRPSSVALVEDVIAEARKMLNICTPEETS